MATFEELEARIAALESRRLTVADLPLASLQRRMENDWKPDPTVLFEEKSIPEAALAPLTRHLVGATGEPAFQNSWGNYGGSFGSAGYVKLGGLVVLFGLVTRSGAPAPSTIFTLPPAFRPPGSYTFPSVTGAPAETFGRIDVLTDGQVQWVAGGTAETDYASLSGIVFPIVQ